MTKAQLNAMVLMSIVDTCSIELDSTGQEIYSLNEDQLRNCIAKLVKNIIKIKDFKN